MSQGDLFDGERQAKLRDRALDRVAGGAPDLVEIATAIAYAIFLIEGEVSATEVWKDLRAKALRDPDLDARLAEADPRWMGAVFRRGWERVRWEASGSHKRPVAVWRRK